MKTVILTEETDAMPTLLTSEQAMAVLRVSRATFWNLKREGYVTPVDENPVLKRQRRLLFRRDEIERLSREGIHPERKAS